MRYKGRNLGGVCFPRTPSFLGFPPRSPPHPRFARVRRLATLNLGAVQSQDRETPGGPCPVCTPSLQTPPLQELTTRGGQEYREGTRAQHCTYSGPRRSGPRPRPESGPRRQGRTGQGRRTGKHTPKGGVDTRRTVVTGPACVCAGRSIIMESSPAARLYGSSRPSQTHYVGNTDLFNGHGSAIAEGDYWVSNPPAMPDYLLDLPTPIAVEYIVARMSLEMISDLSFQQYVHQSPGVHLPKELAYQISVGAKYMFHEPCNQELIRNAWVDFNRRLRWS